MKFLKTETFYEGATYDRLFHWDKHQLIPIDRLFDTYIVSYDLKRTDPFPEIPHELGIRIVLKTIIMLLKDFHFAEAMELIAIAHPKFRPWLIEEAKKQNLIFRDQAFVPGQAGEYRVAGGSRSPLES